MTPTVGEVWVCDLAGKVRWFTGGTAGLDTTGHVSVDWASTDNRVFEGVARMTPRATSPRKTQHVTLASSLFLRRVS